MIFSPPLCEKVLDGSKTVTRHLTKGKPCEYMVGAESPVLDGSGGEWLGWILIVSVNLESSGPRMSPIEAIYEGFNPSDGERTKAFWNYWSELHGPGKRDEPVYRIEFELVEE